MTMDIKFSIIVPVYNSESYLVNCIESLINQTYSNIEIILINDGSTDASLNICEEYQKKDSRIVILNKKNEGPSAARNDGFINACGDFIVCVDSDDFIETNSCEIFASIIRNHPSLDIIASNYQFIVNNKKSSLKWTIPKSEFLCGVDFLKFQLKANTMSGATCRNIIKRSLIVDNGIFFENNIRNSEDEHWIPRIFFEAKYVVTTDFTHYNASTTSVSLTRSKDQGRYNAGVISTCLQLEKFYINLKDNEMRVLLLDYLVKMFLVAFTKGRLYRKEYKNLIDKRFLTKNSFSMKHRLLSYIFFISPRICYVITYIYLYKIRDIVRIK